MGSSNLATSASFDALMNQQFSTDEWKLCRAKLRTYNCVFLPPSKHIMSEQEAEAWVEGVFEDLFRSYESLKGAKPMDQATKPGHFTIVMNTEFGFNGAFEGGTWKFKAKWPVSINVEKRLRESIQSRLAHYRETHNILFVFSCCTLENTENAVVGRNRLTVLSTKSDIATIIPKKFNDKSDGWPDAGVTVEKFGFDVTPATKPGENELHVRKPGVPPSSVNFPNITGQGYAVRLGMGTCLDAKNEIYPDVNLVAFLGGWANEKSIKDHHLGHVFNDTAYWRDSCANANSLKLQMTTINEESCNTEPGVRYWQYQPGFIQVIPPTQLNGTVPALWGPGYNTRLNGRFVNIGVSPTVPLPDGRLYLADGSLAKEAQETSFYAPLQERERQRFWDIIKDKVQHDMPWTVGKITSAYVNTQTNLPENTVSEKCVFGEYLITGQR